MEKYASPEDFDRLLAWLDPDRDQAAEKYLTIRRQLVKMFSWKGASDPEELADQTITRVTLKVEDIREGYVGEPSLYFYSVAKTVLLESKRLSSRQIGLPEEIPAPAIDVDDTRDQLEECLHKCLNELSPADRRLVLTYYGSSKHKKLNIRPALAAQFGVRPATLRMRVHRIRTALGKCIENCVGK